MSQEEVQTWIEKSLGINLPFDLLDSISDGTLLCKLLRKLEPELQIALNEREKTREASLANIEEFLRGCGVLGLPSARLFHPEVLLDQSDSEAILTTLTTLKSLSRKRDSAGSFLSEEEGGYEDFHFEDDQLDFICSSLDFLQQTTSQLSLLVIQDNSMLEDSLKKMHSRWREVESLSADAGSYLKDFTLDLGEMQRARNGMVARLARSAETPQKMSQSREVNFVEQRRRPSITKNTSSSRMSFMRIRGDEYKVPGLFGTMHVSIISATDILPCDPTGFSDPYCVLKVGRENRMEKVAKTSTIIQTLNPVWRETFKISLKNATLLAIRCMDWDRFSQDDICGDVTLDLLCYFVQDKKESKNFNLKFDTQGSLDIHIKWEPLPLS